MITPWLTIPGSDRVHRFDSGLSLCGLWRQHWAKAIPALEEGDRKTWLSCEGCKEKENMDDELQTPDDPLGGTCPACGLLWRNHSYQSAMVSCMPRMMEMLEEVRLKFLAMIKEAKA